MSEHTEHCDCYRQSRASNESWVRAHQEVLARAETAERRAADLEAERDALLGLQDAMVQARVREDTAALEQRAGRAEAERDTLIGGLQSAQALITNYAEWVRATFPPNLEQSDAEQALLDYAAGLVRWPAGPDCRGGADAEAPTK